MEYFRSLFVETPEQALRIWAEYHRDGVDRSGRIGPWSLSRSTPLKGLEIPHAVALFVEETDGYRMAERALRTDYGLTPPTHRVAGLTPEAFAERVAERLPRDFRAPHEEPCEKEYEEKMLGMEAASQA